MNKYLVKALVSRAGGSASLRFVPLEIFDLWKSYMQNAHDCQVRSLQVSLWVSAGVLGDAAAAPGPAAAREPVVHVSLEKRVGAVQMPVERYFAEEEVDRILPTFLAHYGIRTNDAEGMRAVRIQRGIFLPPEEIFGDEA